MARIRNFDIVPKPSPSPQAVSAAQKKINNAIKKQSKHILAHTQKILDSLKALKEIQKEILAEDPDHHAFHIAGPIANAKFFYLPLVGVNHLDLMECKFTESLKGVKGMASKKN
jgi:hypothetical protein